MAIDLTLRTRRAPDAQSDRLTVAVFGGGPPWPPAVAQLLAGSAWCDAGVCAAPAGLAAGDGLPAFDAAIVLEPRGAAAGSVEDPAGIAAAAALSDALMGRRCGVAWIGDGEPPDAFGELGPVALPRDASPDRLRGVLTALAQVRPVLLEADRQLSGLHDLGGQLQKHLEELQRELALAARLQRDLMPRELTEIAPLQFAALHRPCSWVSGDMFDVFRIDEDHAGFYLIDAMGHGVAAALLTMFVRNTIRGGRGPHDRDNCLRPERALSNLSEALIAEKLPDCQFMTGWYGVVNLRTRELRYAVGGHPPALLVEPDGGIAPLPGEGGLLGVFAGMEFAEQSVVLKPGQRVLLFSDGLESILDGNDDGSNEPQAESSAARAAAIDGPGVVALSPAIQEMVRRPGVEFVQALAAHMDGLPGAFGPRVDDVSLVVMDVME